MAFTPKLASVFLSAVASCEIVAVVFSGAGGADNKYALLRASAVVLRSPADCPFALVALESSLEDADRFDKETVVVESDALCEPEALELVEASVVV